MATKPCDIYNLLQNDPKVREDMIDFLRTETGAYAGLSDNEARMQFILEMRAPHFDDRLMLYQHVYDQRMQTEKVKKQKSDRTVKANSFMKDCLATAAISLCALVGSCHIQEGQTKETLRDAGAAIALIAGVAAAGSYIKNKYF